MVGYRFLIVGNFCNCIIVLKIYECCFVRLFKVFFKNLCLVRMKEEGILFFFKGIINMNVINKWYKNGYEIEGVKSK